MKLEVIRKYYDLKLEKHMEIGDVLDVTKERGNELLANPNNIVKELPKKEKTVEKKVAELETAMKDIDEKIETATIKIEKAKKEAKKNKKEED